MNYTAGIDIGSVTAKTVILDEDKNILAQNIVEEGIVNKKSALSSLHQALTVADLKQEQIKVFITTGYGRNLIPFRKKSVSEISCHAIGAHFIMPEARTIIDIGGQDSKVISIASDGLVDSFQMNDKCAAGTGRFIEVMARALKLSLDEMGEISFMNTKPCHVSSMCTVFAESEIISLSAQGIPKNAIISGLYESIARRTLSLLSAIRVQPAVVMSGGVAKNKKLVKVIEQIIGSKIIVPPEPQIIGALGAAYIAWRINNQNG